MAISVGFTLRVIWFALSTNFKVFMVSSKFLTDGERFAMTKVYVFPVKDS